MTVPKNSFLRSESMSSGTPCTCIQYLHRVAIASAANLVFEGKNETHLVYKSTTVRMYLNPSEVMESRVYRSIPTARKGVEESIGTKGVLKDSLDDLARLQLTHFCMYEWTALRIPLK